MKKLNSERRLYPRIQQSLPINLAADGYDFSTTTDNISCVGAYCKVDKYIPPFTKIAIKLCLFMSGGKSRGLTAQCKGVVVRTEDDQNEGFNVAIFFNEIKDPEKQKIHRYISQFIPQSSPS